MELLLKKLREMTALLQQEKGFVTEKNDKSYYQALPFQNIAEILCRITDANIYIINQEGILVGYNELYTMNSPRFTAFIDEKQFPEYYIKQLESLTKTYENISIDQDYSAFPVENREMFGDGITTIIPIYVSGMRLGNLILARIGKLFETDDLILAEYSATVVGLELLHFSNHLQREKQRQMERIKMAKNSLSYSEKIAVKQILANVSDVEFRITASKIASEYNITRSVIVNALRKLESAGLLEAQSLGMKGTHIRIKSYYILQEMQKIDV